MNKHAKLGVGFSVVILQCSFLEIAYAVPLLPIDARGLAMGSTGVASAKLAHAPQYNPALLSTAAEDEDFAIVLPQVGSVGSDEEDMIDSVDAIAKDEYSGGSNGDTIFEHFEGITDQLDAILVSGGPGMVPIEQQLEGFKTLIKNVPGNGGNDNTTSAQLTQAATNLNTSAQALTGQTQNLEATTLDFTNSLSAISGRAIRGTVGINGAIAIPSKTFAAAISVSGSAFLSGRMFFTDNDASLLNGYAEAINSYADSTQTYTNSAEQLATAVESLDNCQTNNSGNAAACAPQAYAVGLYTTQAESHLSDLQTFSYDKDGRTILSTDSATGDIILNDDLTSNVQIVAVGISEVGLTLSSNFEIAGKNIAIGITPKLQSVKTFNYAARVEEDINKEAITDTEQDFAAINLDAGAAYQFGDNNQWQVGLIAKNLISKEYETESNPDTQFRSGISHSTDWTVIAFDIDLMENDPVAFEAPTQYASLGTELDLFDTLQFRAGYRTNLSLADSAVVSAGLGFSPFGAHLDVAVMANPKDVKREAGAALELGFYF